MKWVWITVKSHNEAWYEQAARSYQEKISYHHPLEWVEIRSAKLARDDAQFKVEAEAAKILKIITPYDGIVLFDPLGKAESSESFSRQLEKWQLRSFKRLVFIVGGAFGVSEQIKCKAHWRVQLSLMIMNHQVASLMALEQVYRAICIQKNHPYHNPSSG